MTDTVGINHCKDCGICCESFMLENPHIWGTEYPNDKRLYRWLNEDIISLEPEEVIALGYIDESWVFGTIDMPGCWFYSCRLYNKELQECTEHDDRPFICRDFPSNLKDTESFITPCNLAIQLYGNPSLS